MTGPILTWLALRELAFRRGIKFLTQKAREDRIPQIPMSNELKELLKQADDLLKDKTDSKAVIPQ